MGKSAWDVRVKSEQTANNNVTTMTCSDAYHSRTVLPPREGGGRSRKRCHYPQAVISSRLLTPALW